MKDYFVGNFNNNIVEFTREYTNENDIWYMVTLGVEGKQLKLRMHNNKIGIWRIMGNRVPHTVLRMEEQFNEVIRRNEGLIYETTKGISAN
jgi:hypothetical protein